MTNYKIYLQATTLGGQIARKEIDLSITPFKCRFFVNPSRAFIVVPYVEDNDIDVYDTINTSIAMETIDEEKCPLDQMIIYKKSNDYPVYPFKIHTTDDMTLPMNAGTQGNYDFYFAIGSSKNLHKSPLSEAFITICGRERLTLSGPTTAVKTYVWPAKLQSGSNTQKVIEENVYEKWFTLKNDENIAKVSSIDCKVNDYQL